MKRQDNSHRAGRRNFFKKAFLLGGTTVLTVLGGRSARAATFPDRPEKPRKRGYRLTPHIRKYYEKASL
jgi:hypothetical protein